MTAAIRQLPVAGERPAVRCPHCGAGTELRGGPTYSTPIGVRRFRACAHCRRTFHTLEHVAAHYHDAALSVPIGTPLWVQRALEWLARAAATLIGGGETN